MTQDKNAKTIERWLRQQLFRNREVPLEKVVLKSVGLSASRGTEVDSFPLGDNITGDNINMLAEEILQRAQQDADGQGGKFHRYMLVARELGKDDDSARLAFRCRGEVEEGDEDGDLQPTERGLVSQLMRHNETIMRMAMMGSAALATQMAKRVESAEKRVEEMVLQRMEDLKAIEAAKTAAHERDMQMLLTSGQEDRKNELFKKLELIFPLIVNKIAGKSVIPSGINGDIFKTLANSFTPDQLGQIAQFLTQEQQMLFLTLLKSARESNPPNGEAS